MLVIGREADIVVLGLDECRHREDVIVLPEVVLWLRVPERVALMLVAVDVLLELVPKVRSIGSDKRNTK